MPTATSNAPTPEYRRYHRVEAPRINDAHFRSAWHKVDRLDKLLRAKAITPREHRAALAFCAAHESAHVGPGGLRACATPPRSGAASTAASRCR